MDKINDYRYRAEITPENIERLIKLANNIGFSPNKVVNVLVKIGIEVIERSAENITDELKNKLNLIIKDLNNERQKNKTI